MQRVSPMCEIRHCPDRADFFWHAARSGIWWIPVCAKHAEEFAPQFHDAFIVAALPESPDPEYRGSGGLTP